MKLLGVISDCRAFKSKSPAMHNRVLAEHGIDGAYVPLAVAPDQMDLAVAGLRALGFSGANVTVPFKEEVMVHLDNLAPEAEAVGAVNTIVIRDQVMTGYNTDTMGFSAALAEKSPDLNKDRVLVLGTGGAAKAVAKALSDLGFREITLCGRIRPGKDRFPWATDWLDLARLGSAPQEMDLLVNATSVSGPEEAPNLAALANTMDLRGCGLVFDLNYGRAENIWRNLAVRAKAEFMDGPAMLAHQAAESFRLWTGIKAAASEFLAVLENEG